MPNIFASALRRFSQLMALALLIMPQTVLADAKTPTISGNGWVALAIIVGLIAVIYFIIAGAMHLEKRDARLGRGPGKRDDGWFGIFPAGNPDDEDAPDFHRGDGNGDGSN